MLFDRDKAVLSRSAGADASTSRPNFCATSPAIAVTVRVYCSPDEGARAGPKVLAELRANQLRDALKARGIAGDRIKIESACQRRKPAISPPAPRRRRKTGGRC